MEGIKTRARNRLLAFFGRTIYVCSMLDAIFFSLGALAAPASYPLPPEHRPIIVAPSVQDAMRADWQALRNDWLIVGNDLAKAADKVAHGKTEASA